MSDCFLDKKNLPFCKGCSHHLTTRMTDKALQMLNVNPLDVILVTDIGCHGIIDRRFHTHTVHGLHGRSVALGAGISAALSNPDKKVIVFIGDGGATIGMNHLVAAAHRNFDMTVVLHNNMLYGMTGGQPSDLTPGGFTVQASMSGFTDEFLDLTEMVKNAGAAYACRIVAKGDFSEQLAEAVSIDGFSMIEVLEICPSYGMKHNADLNISNLVEKLQIPLGTWKSGNIKKADVSPRENIRSLFDSLETVEEKYTHKLTRETSVLIGGSAGEGVQVAANLFAKAAMSCGLNVTVKGNYPVTVGTGFSASEITLSPNPIKFTGLGSVDYAVLSSQDGMNFLRSKLANQPSAKIILDSSITSDNMPGSTIFVDFRTSIKAREVNLAMLMLLLNTSEIFPIEAFVDAVSSGKIGNRVDVEFLMLEAERIRELI